MNRPPFMRPSCTRKRSSPFGEIAETILIALRSPVLVTTGVGSAWHSGGPFGYRYVPRPPSPRARYEVIDCEAVLVAEMFRRYADDGATIADLARWLGGQGAVTRTGKHRWDRSVIWGMLRNPAYAGRAVFGKTQIIHAQPGLNRVAQLQGRTTPRAVKTVDRPREE